MKLDKQSAEEVEEASESSDCDDTSDIPSSASQQILSSSPSLSDEESTKIDHSDRENNFIGHPKSLKINNEIIINANPAFVKPETINVYDREKVFHKLANLAGSENGREFLRDVIRMHMGSDNPETKLSTESTTILEDDQTTAEDQHKSLVDCLRKTLQPIPDSVLHLTTGWFRSVNTEQSADQKPDWLDMDKFLRGQKFAQDHSFSVLYGELISLLQIYSFDDGLKPLIISGNSSTPYTAFRRFLSTGQRIKSWYTHDPWTKGTLAYKNMMVVRAMHKAMTQRLASSPIEEIDAASTISNAWCPGREILLKDFAEACDAPVPGQCPYAMNRNNPNRPKHISQVDMIGTQWSFIVLVLLNPKSIGIHYATDEELDAFSHMWRGLGYQLGIEDEFNFCRGTLEEVQQRCREFRDTWIKPNFREITPEWEHMTRCLITGMSTLVPIVNYEIIVLHLMEILELQMPRLSASLSYKDWIFNNIWKSLFFYGMKLPGITGLANTVMKMLMNRAANYSPKQLEAVRAKLSNYTWNNRGTNENSVG